MYDYIWLKTGSIDKTAKNKMKERERWGKRKNAQQHKKKLC